MLRAAAATRHNLPLAAAAQVPHYNAWINCLRGALYGILSWVSLILLVLVFTFDPHAVVPSDSTHASESTYGASGTHRRLLGGAEGFGHADWDRRYMLTLVGACVWGGGGAACSAGCAVLWQGRRASWYSPVLLMLNGWGAYLAHALRAKGDGCTPDRSCVLLKGACAAFACWHCS